MASLLAFLQSFEPGIICIEVARKHGLRLISTKKGVDIQKQQPEIDGYNKDQATLVVQMLQRKKTDVVSIVADPDSTREALCKALEALSHENTQFLVKLDLLDRLERAYRIVNPDITGCINGDTGCPRDSVMSCSACNGGANA